MKTLRFFAFAFAAVSVFFSCQKEISVEIVEQQPSGLAKEHVSFEACGEATKTVLDFADPVSNVKWADSDQIAVFDGTTNNVFSIKAGSNKGATATFEGEVTEGSTTLYAVYPASAAELLSEGLLRLTVPATQNIASEACADYSAIASVSSAAKNADMAFKQVCALLKITVTSADIQEIRINGANLAGTVDVAPTGELQSVVKGVDEIILTHADGLFPIGTFYAALLPGTTPAGQFSISLVKIGRTGTKTASSAVTFERCKGLDAGALDDLTYRVEIHDMAELFNWNEHRSASEKNDIVICADIDMENEPWTPKDFVGTFDGQGHKLYNLNVNRTSNACFINSLTGTIKDVTFGSSDGTSYDGVSAIIQNNPEDDGASWRYVGLVTRLNEDASMSNVVSFVPVTVAATSISKTRVGGLVGIVNGAASMTDCTNNGAVSNLAAAPAAAGSLGGVIGWPDAVVTCNNVDNCGNITVTNAQTTYVGGILSSDETGCSFTGCDNSGNISISGSGTRAMSVGGILGDATNSTLVSCTNSGSISNSLGGEMKMGGIIGRAYIGCSLTDCVNSASGTIVSNPESASNRTFIGGIVGNSPAKNNTSLSIVSCKNYADITTANAQVATVSGIAGYLNGPGLVTIKDCENRGNMSNTNGAALNGSTAAHAYVSGIVGYLTSSMLAGSSIDGCKNYGAVSSSNRNINYVAGVIPVFQSDNAVSLKDCHNYGTVTRNCSIRTNIKKNSTDYDTDYCVGGIVGKINLGAGSVTGCYNHSEATVWANAGGGSAVPRVGGIVAYVVKCPEISGCTNDAAVTYDNTATGGSYMAIGGIAGHVYATPVINNCTNSGAVSANRTQVNRVGGIVGTANNSAVTNCTNNGSVTLNSTAQTANWQSVGGVVGFAEGSGDTAKDITGNVNSGKVSVTVKSSNERVAVGGVIGMPYSAFTVTDNANYGAVSANNTSATAACYVGGIVGQEHNAANVSTISNNKNYGTVSNESVDAEHSFAGGIMGSAGQAPSISGFNFGAVNGVNAAAIAGFNTTLISATICSEVTVNGATYDAASDKDGWLCASNAGGIINPTFVAHSSEE